MAWSDKDVSEKYTYVYSRVEVKTCDRKTTTGWVYTIDPITHSIVLLNDNQQLVTILGHAVREVLVKDMPNKDMKNRLDELLESKEPDHSPEVLEERKQKVVAWLLENRFPVKANGDIISVANALEIMPPYSASSCQTGNEVILNRIQRLLEAMPI
ncbi:gem-associated protein 6-like [Clavelina lepadiformis]|uniref:gem-associated protein 6-like n=1 Tax=Clavelina lepadiformis TaxID=159417 RepID=UPI004041D7FA